MKLVIAFLLVAVTVAYASQCVHNNPSACTVTCPAGETKACEHDVCTCARICTLAGDCSSCPTHTDPMGHTHQESVHCIDGACVCTPEHQGPGQVGPGGR